MRFLKSLFSISFVIIFTTAKAQDTLTVARDTTANFHADVIHFAPVLTRRSIPDTTLQRLRYDKAFWYANTNFKKPAVQKSANVSFLQWLLRQAWFYNLLWIIIISSFIAVIIVFLLKSNVRLFHKAPAPIAANETETWQENIFSINYEESIKNAVAQYDFRQAIRLHYLQVLALLSSKKIILFKEEYTNSDYLMQLRDTANYTRFKQLTRHFEYAWYGKFAITQNAFTSIEADFTRFKNNMGI